MLVHVAIVFAINTQCLAVGHTDRLTGRVRAFISQRIDGNKNWALQPMHVRKTDHTGCLSLSHE